MSKEQITGERTHIAARDGYANGFVRAGEAVPAGFPIGSWMQKSPLAQSAPAAGTTVTGRGRTFDEMAKG